MTTACRQLELRTAHPRRRRARPLLKPLKGRRLLPRAAVTTTVATGPGNLLAAIQQVNSATDPSNALVFSIPAGRV